MGSLDLLRRERRLLQLTPPPSKLTGGAHSAEHSLAIGADNSANLLNRVELARCGTRKIRRHLGPPKPITPRLRPFWSRALRGQSRLMRTLRHAALARAASVKPRTLE